MVIGLMDPRLRVADNKIILTIKYFSLRLRVSAVNYQGITFHGARIFSVRQYAAAAGVAA
jgi:hypothetical protein